MSDVIFIDNIKIMHIDEIKIQLGSSQREYLKYIHELICDFDLNYVSVYIDYQDGEGDIQSMDLKVLDTQLCNILSDREYWVNDRAWLNDLRYVKKELERLSKNKLNLK